MMFSKRLTLFHVLRRPTHTILLLSPSSLPAFLLLKDAVGRNLESVFVRGIPW